MSADRYLADTNILSELVRPRPNAGVFSWASRVFRVSVSAVTVEEITFGLARKEHPKLRQWFDEFFADRCNVLPVTAIIADGAGRLRGRLARRGKVRDQADMLIAATAQVHQLTLVTRNTKDFESCGIGLLDPFADDSLASDEVHEPHAPYG